MWTLLLAPASAAPAPVKIELHTTIQPQRTGVREEDYWIQFQAYGLITNTSTETLEAATATITFHDADGDLLAVDSIGTAVKADVGDLTPGETILAEVGFVAPGQSGWATW